MHEVYKAVARLGEVGRCGCVQLVVHVSDQRIAIFSANRNRNRFAKPSSVQIGIGIVREVQNLQIGIGIVFVRWEVFTNYSQIPKINLFLYYFLSNIFFLILIHFLLKNLQGKQSQSEL